MCHSYEAVIGTRHGPWIEKESAEITLEFPEIEWTSKDNDDSNLKKSAQFKLGNFDSFGKFLEVLIGEEIKEEKKIDNK